MKKCVVILIMSLSFFCSKNLISENTDKLIHSNILGAVSSLIMPAKASVAISLLPYLLENDQKDFDYVNNEDIVLTNEISNSSIKYTNSINYKNSLN